MIESNKCICPFGPLSEQPHPLRTGQGTKYRHHAVCNPWVFHTGQHP